MDKIKKNNSSTNNTTNNSTSDDSDLMRFGHTVTLGIYSIKIS